MFSCKSDELLKEYNHIYHKSKILLFKPNIDTRNLAKVKTRNNKEVPAIIISDLKEIYDYLEDKITTIFLVEVNFIKGDNALLMDLSV